MQGPAQVGVTRLKCLIQNDNGAVPLLPVRGIILFLTTVEE